MSLTAGESFLKSILDVFKSKTANGTVSKTTSLSGTATALPDFKCKGVEFLGTVTLTLGGGDAISYSGGVIPCNNASEILVSGTGSVSYIIYI